jgi:hypothetical protein
MSIKISNDPTENRTRDLPTCSAVPQIPASLPFFHGASSPLSQGVKPLLWATRRAAGVVSTESYTVYITVQR